MKNRLFAELSVLLLTVQTLAMPAWGATNDYKEQMRAYHAKLLAYQVQPGRSLEQRKSTCQMLKDMTNKEQNVDALWAKFDALERRVRGTDIKYTDECSALLAEVKNKVQQYEQGQRDTSEKKNSESAAASQALAKTARETETAAMMKGHSPPSGAYSNRRKRIWEELKRCYAQKKEVGNHVLQYQALLEAQSSGKGDLNDMCNKLEDSLALPHNIKD